MDAALMEGRTLKAGAVAGIEAVRHPISAARLVLEKTAHVLLIGPHATRFARHFKMERQPTNRRRSARAAVRGNTSREAVTATGPQRRMLRLYRQMLGGRPWARARWTVRVRSRPARPPAASRSCSPAAWATAP